MNPRELWSHAQAAMRREFHCPDVQGVLIALCAACSHYYPSEKPVWLLVLGASGSGKTEILANSLLNLPLSRAVDDLTPKAFLSSWGKGPGNKLLPVPVNGSPGSALWVAADFTTLCSLSGDDRKKVAASLRQIWDGKLARDTGQGPGLSWTGKVSFIAMATPEVEESWGSMRGLGERFMYLRWRSPSDLDGRLGAIRKSRAQIGRVDQIRSELGALVSQLADPRRFPDALPPPDSAMVQLDLMSELVAYLRVHVERDYDNARSILRISTAELPTRISAAFSQIARTHQAMFDSPPIEESLALIRRLALDTIPQTRKQILDLIPLTSGVTYGDLLELTRIPKTTLIRTLEDLTAMDVLDRNTGLDSDALGRWASFSQWFREQLINSQLLEKL